MSETGERDGEVVRQEFHLDAEPEKVWRAVSQGPLREAWLPDQKVLEVLSEEPAAAIELLIEEREAPFARSIVRFGPSPAPGGGTDFSIRHRPLAAILAANDNRAALIAA